MKTITRLGTFDEVIAKTKPEVREICLELRKTIIDLHPECVEVPRPGERFVSYGYGEKKMSEAYAYIMPQAGYANLGFFQGAQLDANSPVLEGTGKKLRHIKVRSVEQAQSEVVRQILKLAMEERAQALGKTMDS